MAEVSHEDFLKEYKSRSASLSTTSRSTALGVIGGLWAIMIAERLQLGTAIFGLPVAILVRVAFCTAAGALLLDLLQNIAAFWMYDIGLNRADKRATEGEETDDLGYTREYLGTFGIVLYWVSCFIFPLKLGLAVAGGVAFVLVASTITV